MDPCHVDMQHTIGVRAVQYSNRSAHPVGARAEHAEVTSGETPRYVPVARDTRSGALRITVNSTPHVSPVGHFSSSDINAPNPS